jgi:GNAT superfamily N-acetyltransferase
MPLAVRDHTHPHPTLAPLPGLAVVREHDAARMAALQGRDASEIAGRFARGHRAYVAHVHGEPAAWGWVATRSAEIGELGTRFDVPAGERYLWNFVTRPSHRGLGIYPRLLDAIVRAESAEATRFWVAYAPENHASGSGIRKAGFATVAELSFDAAGRAALHALPTTRSDDGRAASRVLGLAAASEALAPCWRCVRAGRGPMSCAAGACRCDYQRPEQECATV